MTPGICQRLQFTYGVHAVCGPINPEGRRAYAGNCLPVCGIEGKFVVPTRGPSSKHPQMNHSFEIIDLERPETAEASFTVQ